MNGDVTVLEGEYAGPLEPREPVPAEPVVVFAGRHIPEKRVPALVPALALARERIPELRGEIYGDGPERDQVLRLRTEHGLDEVLEVPGFVEAEQVERALARALCMVLPSSREGYGLVVVEAAAAGTPSVVVAGPDNAATELIEEGENGYIAPSASAGRPRRRDRARARGGPGVCATARQPGSGRTPSACRSSGSLDKVHGQLPLGERAPVGSRRSAPRRAPR